MVIFWLLEEQQNPRKKSNTTTFHTWAFVQIKQTRCDVLINEHCLILYPLDRARVGSCVHAN